MATYAEGESDQYMVDTGAAVCVALSSQFTDTSSRDEKVDNLVELISADGSPITVYGWKSVPLSVGGADTMLEFLISDGPYPILGACALNRLGVDFVMRHSG